MNREQRHNRAAGKPREEEEEEEREDFYDCQETLESADSRKVDPQYCHRRPETLTDRGEEPRGGRLDEQRDGLKEDEEVEEQRDGLKEDEEVEEQRDGQKEDKEVEEQRDGLKDEETRDGLKVEHEDSDSEMQQQQQQVEFDDDYLREVEKELTDEEKESRRQQSLSLKETGNGQFKAADWAAAARTYSEALVLCPVCFSAERSVLFANRAAARVHLELKDQAISDCSRAIELNPDYIRALLRRAELYEQTEKLDEALDDYKKVLERDPNHSGARRACVRLPQQIQERNEKLKEEMMSKLKDLGNMILRPFGLSTNNFQVNQDQNTGSYSINFIQNNNNNNR